MLVRIDRSCQISGSKIAFLTDSQQYIKGPKVKMKQHVFGVRPNSIIDKQASVVKPSKLLNTDFDGELSELTDKELELRVKVLSEPESYLYFYRDPNQAKMFKKALKEFKTEIKKRKKKSITLQKNKREIYKKKNVEKYKQIRCFQIPFPQYGSDDDDILNGLGPLTPVPMSSSLDFSFLNKEPEWINLALVVT